MTSLVSSLLSILLMRSSEPEVGSSEDHPLQTLAVPGLMTLLDVALYNSFEGELTATVTSSHNLLAAWLDLKRQSIVVLHCILNDRSDQISRIKLIESFARACLDVSSDVIERITTDQFSSSANLTDPFRSLEDTSTQNEEATTNSSFNNKDTFATAIQDSVFDTGRRLPLLQRGKDCWESPRLFCPDYINFDDAVIYCQRKIRELLHHGFVLICSSQVGYRPILDGLVGGSTGSSSGGNSLPFIRQSSGVPSLANHETEREALILLQVVCHDIPLRLVQFRSSVESDSEVSKRLYLLKNEFRAPFRAFMEAHLSLQRAPTVGIVEEYLKLASSSQTKLIEQRRTEDKSKLQSLLEVPVLLELLALEQQIEEIEIDIAKQLYPFSELARYLEYKRVRLVPVSDVLTGPDIPFLLETIHRLKSILCRTPSVKSGTKQLFPNAETSAGIRPILLVLQGMDREDDLKTRTSANTDTTLSDSILVESRLNLLLNHIKTLGKLCLTRNAFRIQKKNMSAGDTLDNIPATIARGCAEEFDAELFRCQIEDWCAMVKRQHDIAKTSKPDMDSLSESIRQAEIKVSLASANAQSLVVVLKRLEQMSSDREKRFKVLKEIVEDICLREMDLHVRLEAPDPKKVLELKPTSTVGFFGVPLQMAGETLPIG
jgi:hypothetical protein